MPFFQVWFAKGMWPVLGAMSGAAGEAGALLSGLELLLMGVTTTASGEICTPNRETLDGVATGVQRVGIRALVSRIVMDSADESSGAQYIPPEYRETPAQASEELRRLQRAYASDRLSMEPWACFAARPKRCRRCMRWHATRTACSRCMWRVLRTSATRVSVGLATVASPS